VKSSSKRSHPITGGRPMRQLFLRKMFLVGFVLVASTHPAQAGKRGGGDGRINKLSGPTMLSYSVYYRFPITAVPEPGAALDFGRDRFWLSLSAGFGRSIDNDLEYPAGLDESRTVKVFTFEPSIDYQFNRFEASAGYLLNIFYGEAFSAFGRDALDLELGVRPFYARVAREGLGWNNLKLSLLATYYTNGITGEDFGARPGSFAVGSDLVWGFQASYDFF
ncbi:MAG: hypothetical protein ACRD1X_06175, partial [Vicinamibacteria bacterium]